MAILVEQVGGVVQSSRRCAHREPRWTDDEPSLPSREANLVRPYTLTAGRTDTSVDLPLEAPVQTLQAALAHRWPPNEVTRQDHQLCTKSPSVAEISARLDLPLGVARVLVGDLVHLRLPSGA